MKIFNLSAWISSRPNNRTVFLTMICRWSVLCALLCSVALLALVDQSSAQTRLFVRGAGNLFPVAVAQLCLDRGDSEANREIQKVISRDLDLSGYFRVIDPGGYVETPGKCPGPDGFAYSDWSVIGAEGLVRGTVSAEGNRIRVQLYLHDVPRQQAVLGKEYDGDPSQAAQIAHRFANEIMKFFTGEEGVFGTRIAFTSRVGRFKELFMMDMDGANIRQITNDRSLAVSPAWSRNGRELVFTSYRGRVPDLFLVDVDTKRSVQLTRGNPMELGARFSPDGALLALSQTSGNDSDIVLMRRDGTIASRLTKPNGAIDVSPDWSPDGSQIVFCSNRGGGPQIYTMGSDGSGVKRISFVNSNYCTSPAWAPNGERIAFVCRVESNFHVFTSNPDGTDPLQLTTVGDNEDPDWAPNGRYITFATTFGRGYAKSIGLMRFDGSSIKQLTQTKGEDGEPVWGPIS